MFVKRSKDVLSTAVAVCRRKEHRIFAGLIQKCHSSTDNTNARYDKCLTSVIVFLVGNIFIRITSVLYCT